MMNSVWVTNAICILRLNGYYLLADDVNVGYESVQHGVSVSGPVRDAILDAKDELVAMGLADTASVLQEVADVMVVDPVAARAMA